VSERFKELMAEYGAIALVLYLSIFAAVLVGFAAAIRTGVDVDSAAGETGLWASAWLATKAVQPIRIGATLVLTPVIGSIWFRVTGRTPNRSTTSADPDSSA
jgi:hypothetical protein